MLLNNNNKQSSIVSSLQQIDDNEKSNNGIIPNISINDDDNDNDNEYLLLCYVKCRVKFYDHKKGFGIITPIDDGKIIINNDNNTKYYINNDIKVFNKQLNNNSVTQQLYKGVLVNAILKQTSTSSTPTSSEYTIICDNNSNNDKSLIVELYDIILLRQYERTSSNSNSNREVSALMYDNNKEVSALMYNNNKEVSALVYDNNAVMKEIYNGINNNGISSIINDLINGYDWIVNCIINITQQQPEEEEEEVVQEWFNNYLYPKIIEPAITQILQNYNIIVVDDNDDNNNNVIKWIESLLLNNNIYITPNRRNRLEYTLSLIKPNEDNNNNIYNNNEFINHVINNRDDGLIVILDGVRDIHNICGMYRLCDALGINNIYLLPPQLQQQQGEDNNNKVIRNKRTANGISRRCKRYINIKRYNNHNDVIHELHNNGYIICSTDLSSSDAIPYYNINTNKLGNNKLAIVFGQESCGISYIMRDNSDIKLYIPLYGIVDSLNICTAAAILLQYIMLYRRNNNLIIPLNNYNKNKLLKAFNNKSF